MAKEKAHHKTGYEVKAGPLTLTISHDGYEPDESGRYSHADVIVDRPDMIPLYYQVYFSDGRAESVAAEVIDELVKALNALA